MQRNHTIVDGTAPGGAHPCTTNPADQRYGTPNSSGDPIGRNGIVAYQANGVSIENLTVVQLPRRRRPRRASRSGGTAVRAPARSG